MPDQHELLGGASPSSEPHATLPASSMEQHRARLRRRLLTGGPDALTDRELLEMTLFLALPRRDTTPVADRLIARFGSFARAVAAPAGEVAAVDGMGEASAAALKLVQAAALRLTRAKAVSLASPDGEGTGDGEA